MGRPVVTTLTIAAADPDGYALAQTKGAAGDLTLNGALVSGGVGTPDAARRVGITSAGDDSGITFTVYGTARAEENGVAISEVVAGTNVGVAETTLDFATVTRIATSAATAANVTAGTTAKASGPWVPWDVNRGSPFNLSVAGKVASGSPTYEVEVTYDSVWDIPTTYPTPVTVGGMAGLTGSAYTTLNAPVTASRLTLTAIGGVTLTQTQQGI